MKNTINYYYNISVENLIKTDQDYYFYFNADEYHLIKYDRPIEDLNDLYKLNVQMKSMGCLIHEIILNKDNQAITLVNGSPYILIKLCRYKNDKVFLNDINYMQNMTYNIKDIKLLNRNNWVKLWSDKIDYYEYQINQIGKKYPILCDSLSYFIGLGENAISYLVNNVKPNDTLNDFVVSHKRIKHNLGSFDFYNPLNMIIDSRVRDVSEYIKNTFFYGEFSFYELQSYLNHNRFTNLEYIYFYSRMLFPTYYFDIYDQIINSDKDEEMVIPILKKTKDYELLLQNIYKFIVYEKKVQLEPVEWILKMAS